MVLASELVTRVARVKHGFGDIRACADELAGRPPAERRVLALALLDSDVYQARMLGTLLLGQLSPADAECLVLLHGRVSRDADWRVQEMLARAFDMHCAAAGYEQSLPLIADWLADQHANVRRAASEGPRIWTSRPYFRSHPELAIELLSRLRADPSEYARTSAGNALRDISRKHASLVRAALDSWVLDDPRVKQTYSLAVRFLGD